MPRRGGPPLFELLEGSRGVPPPAAPKPANRPQRPASTPQPARPARPAEPVAPDPVAEVASSTRKSTFTMPKSTVYAAAAAFLAFGVGGYAIGYVVGESDTEQRYESEGLIPQQPPTLRLPGDDPRQPETGNSGTQRTQTPTEQPHLRQPGTPRQETTLLPSDPVSPATGRVYASSSGWSDADPRQPGTNYLALATLPRDQAVAAVGYLAAAGVDALAVRVDSGRAGGDNSARFAVHSLGLAVPSGQFRTMGVARNEHVRRIREIGRLWAAEGGQSSFDQPFWTRFDG